MSVDRDVQISADSEREIVVKREFNAPPQMVFDAHTKPELVKRWLSGLDGWSMPVCEIELRVGGGYRYVWRQDSDGTEMGISGVFKEIEVPKRIVHTEAWDEAWYPGEGLITTLFEDLNGKTKVTMTVRYGSREIRDSVLETGAADGMNMSYDRLETLLMELTVDVE